MALVSRLNSRSYEHFNFSLKQFLSMGLFNYYVIDEGSGGGGEPG